jgi:hypothetical protein
MPLTAGQRVLRGRIAAYSRWSREPNRTEATARLRAGFDRRFEVQVDPEGRLDPGVRALLVRSARQAYFVRLAYLRVNAANKKARKADNLRAGGAARTSGDSQPED